MRSLRGRLVLLVAVVMLPGACVTGWLVTRVYVDARSDVERNLKESVSAFSQLTDALLREREALLTGLAAALRAEDGDLSGFAQHTATLATTTNEWFVLTDSNGRQLLNTSQSPDVALPTVELSPDLIDALRDGRTHVSNLSVSPATGRPVVHVTIPIRRRAAPPWALSAVLSTDAIAHTLIRPDIGSAWLISVIDREGRIIARSRDPSQFVGVHASESMLSRIRGAPSGIEETVTLDSVESLTAYEGSPLSGWTVIVAAPRTELLRSAKTLAVIAGAVSLLCGLAGIVLAASVGRAVVHAVQRLVGQTRALSRGPSPMQATGIIETDIVSHALAEASQRLASREAELARTRDDALEASRAKDEFLATLSHELRTPLNPVLLLASDAATDPAIPAETRELFEAIEKNVRLEARLIDDLLDLTRITRGKISLDKQRVDVHTVIHDAIETVAERARAGNIAVRRAFSATTSHVHGDAVRLQQVFWNLLNNAIKFTPEGGRVEIRTWDGTDAVEVAVADTGLGLTADEQSRIFEAFVQGEHALRASGGDFGGLGLGLAISRLLVEKHGGTIRATSPGRDQGATFIVSLPVHGECDSAEDAFTEAHAPGG